MKRLLAPAVFILPALLSAGCNAIGIACPHVGSYAINVDVRDATTGESAANGAVLVVRDGEYADSVMGSPESPPVLAAAFERTGLFDVVVRKEGYQIWQREDIRVSRGGACDELKAIKLTAMLEPVQR